MESCRRNDQQSGAASYSHVTFARLCCDDVVEELMDRSCDVAARETLILGGTLLRSYRLQHFPGDKLDTIIPSVSSMIASVSFFCLLLGLRGARGDLTSTIDQSQASPTQLVYSPPECWQTNNSVSLSNALNVSVARDNISATSTCTSSTPGISLFVDGKQYNHIETR